MPGIPRSVDSAEFAMRSFWLPPGTRGNGLDADRWARIATLRPVDVDEVLVALRAAGVPARARRARRAGGGCELYVASAAYGRAENVLLRAAR